MLAVLPFENLSGDPSKEYLADGLTEETISQLGRLNPERLGVIARTSVMGYKHKDERPSGPCAPVPILRIIFMFDVPK
jgi:TolB-like protein